MADKGGKRVAIPGRVMAVSSMTKEEARNNPEAAIAEADALVKAERTAKKIVAAQTAPAVAKPASQIKLPKTAQKLLDRAQKSPHKTFSVTTAIRRGREDGIREKQAAEILVKEGLAKPTGMERSTDTLRDGTYRKVNFYTRTYQLL